MSRYQSQFLYGFFIAVTGICISILSGNPSRIIQYTVAAGIFIASVFAFVTMTKAKDEEIPMKYNSLQGLGLLAFSVAIFIYASTLERFITLNMFFILYFGITEILVGFELLNYKKTISVGVIVLKMLIGLLMTVGAVLILGVAETNKNISLLFSGILMTLSGLSFIWLSRYSMKMGAPY